MAATAIGKDPRYLGRAVEMLIGTDIADDPKLADEMCGAMAYGHINPKNLSETEVRALLEKMIPTKEIDQHHIGLFLHFV